MENDQRKAYIYIGSSYNPNVGYCNVNGFFEYFTEAMPVESALSLFDQLIDLRKADCVINDKYNRTVSIPKHQMETAVIMMIEKDKDEQ